MDLPVDIFRCQPEARLPQYQTPGACAFDLAPVVDAFIAPGEIVRLPTGLIICLPAGYCLLIVARSSLPKRYGLSIPQGLGIIDNDFCGQNDELMLQLLNFTARPVTVKKGERLAQGIIIPFVRAQFHEVVKLTGASRGGFGTTG